MKLINKDPFRIWGRVNEKITVTVLANGTELRVVYSLLGNVTDLHIDETIEFRIPLHATELAFTFGFSNREAGRYRIIVKGDPHTDISEYVLYQSPTTSRNLVYEFYAEDEGENQEDMARDLGGDETKGDYESPEPL